MRALADVAHGIRCTRLYGDDAMNMTEQTPDPLEGLTPYIYWIGSDECRMWLCREVTEVIAAERVAASSREAALQRQIDAWKDRFRALVQEEAPDSAGNAVITLQQQLWDAKTAGHNRAVQYCDEERRRWYRALADTGLVAFDAIDAVSPEVACQRASEASLSRGAAQLNDFIEQNFNLRVQFDAREAALQQQIDELKDGLFTPEPLVEQSIIADAISALKFESGGGWESYTQFERQIHNALAMASERLHRMAFLEQKIESREKHIGQLIAESAAQAQEIAHLKAERDDWERRFRDYAGIVGEPR